MKKTISIIVALAMVFVMSFSVFAEEPSTLADETTTLVVDGGGLGDNEESSSDAIENEKPTDPTELGKYYAEKFNEEGISTELAQEFATDVVAAVTEGRTDDITAMLTAFVENADDQQAAYDFLQTVETLIKTVIPDFELPITPPEEDSSEEEPSGDSSEDETLPDEEETEDNGEDAGSGFLNSILGILGIIGDLIFGSDDPADPSDPSDPSEPSDPNDPWGPEPSEPGEPEAPTEATELGEYYAEKFNADGASEDLVAEIVEAVESGKITDVEATLTAFMNAVNDKQAAYDFLKVVETRVKESNPDFVLPIDPPSEDDEEDLAPDTGDTTVLSVAAVALAAGAALILTRKKSEDAE